LPEEDQRGETMATFLTILWWFIAISLLVVFILLVRTPSQYVFDKRVRAAARVFDEAHAGNRSLWTRKVEKRSFTAEHYYLEKAQELHSHLNPVAGTDEWTSAYEVGWRELHGLEVPLFCFQRLARDRLEKSWKAIYLS